ncbi:MAG TPA: cytochrome P450 [Actinocrinis sp.]|nr:cytochrome P450 [Actinocrinis sp.]
MSSAPRLTEPITVPATRGTCPFDPPPAYRQARLEDPVSRVELWDGSTTWMVTRYEDVRAVLGDKRFSAEADRPNFPFTSPGRRELSTVGQSFIRMDDPEHARLRRMLTGDFMLKKMTALRPQVQEIADGLLDRMTADRAEADLVAEFALPLPSLVICLLLGVPYEDHEYFQRCSRVMLDSRSKTEEILEARQSLLDYMSRLTAEKRRSPDDGILSRLAQREDLDNDETARMGLLLLIAGHETTANMTSLSVLALLQNPDQLARLRAEPELMNGAVEELLRYLTIVHSGVARVAIEDIEIGGTTIPAGDGVLCMINEANRDDDAFAHGDALDVARDARRHVAFGFGVHQCLGQPLARLELQVALSTILRKLPGLRLAAQYEDIAFRHEMLIFGVEALPVAW